MDGHMDVTRDDWGENRVLLHDMTDINIPKMATSDISSN